MERNTEISMYVDAPYNNERSIEISMHPYADNMERGTRKFPGTFLVNMQASTEIHIEIRRQKIMNNALVTFWKLLHSLMEFLEVCIYSNICPFGYASRSIKISASCWVFFLCHFSYRPANSLEAALCNDALIHWRISAQGTVDSIKTRRMTEIFAFVVCSIWLAD